MSYKTAKRKEKEKWENDTPLFFNWETETEIFQINWNNIFRINYLKKSLLKEKKAFQFQENPLFSRRQPYSFAFPLKYSLRLCR